MPDLTNTMICWNLGGEVALVPWPDTHRLSDRYQSTSGACYTHVHEADFEQRKVFAFIDALKLMVGYKCDPAVVHAAFLCLDEYVDGLPDDMLPPDLLAQRLHGFDEV